MTCPNIVNIFSIAVMTLHTSPHTYIVMMLAIPHDYYMICICHYQQTTATAFTGCYCAHTHRVMCCRPEYIQCIMNDSSTNAAACCLEAIWQVQAHKTKCQAVTHQTAAGPGVWNIQCCLQRASQEVYNMTSIRS